MNKNSTEYKQTQQYKIGRKLMPVNISVREYDAENDEWNTVSVISANANVHGTPAKNMSDDELVALYINEPKFWTAR